eukprot:TRINITY_DN6328_c0_g1_i2.p1 TRINITY_DN6328_c0_g1~~TRINITY_DN6328_c0_g1_i2.p1  ORF type:complete len:152 (-),score=18.30 TRINITY_DN6328_c0_g1_i2:34-489(-)
MLRLMKCCSRAKLMMNMRFQTNEAKNPIKVIEKDTYYKMLTTICPEAKVTFLCFNSKGKKNELQNVPESGLAVTITPKSRDSSSDFTFDHRLKMSMLIRPPLIGLLLMFETPSGLERALSLDTPLKSGLLKILTLTKTCLLYTSPSPRDRG